MKSILLSALLAAVLAPHLGSQTPIFRPSVRVATPVNLPSAKERSPELSADLRTIYFSSDRNGTLGGMDIWMSTRADLTSAWSTPVNVSKLNSVKNDLAGALRSDGCEMVFSSNRVFTHDLFASGRGTTTLAWTVPAPAPALTTFRDQCGASMTGDGLEMYFWSKHVVTAGLIYRTTRATHGSYWSTPQHVAELDMNTYRPKREPAITSDGLEIVFSSNQLWSAGYDLWYSSRQSRSAKFRAPVNLSELNSTANEDQGRWTRDGFSYYYCIQELGDIFRADRILPICIPTGQPIRGKPFDVACRRDPGDVGVVVGSASPMPPTRIPNARGYLAILPAHIFWQASGVVDKMGRFTTRVPVPDEPWLKGINVHWQVGAQDAAKAIFISTAVTTKIQ